MTAVASVLRQASGARRIIFALHTVVWTLLVLLRTARGSCEYGQLPGTLTQEDDLVWKPYDRNCQLRKLLPYYLGLNGTAPVKPRGEVLPHLEDASILFLGDSVDRSLAWDVNTTALAAHSEGLQTLLNEHWRVALKLPHLEMVYQFAPGSHIVGPYHDDVAWDMTVANALPRGFELHTLLTGRRRPNVVVYSDILWDLGRWLFLSEIAEPERTEHFGKPLLRDQEFLPLELLDEWREDTELQMHRIEEQVEHDTLLIYHNSAFALLKDCKNGTDHLQKGTGKRTHLIQMNALARQIVSDNPRWHLVDLGQMSDAFLLGEHLRDEHHPNLEFMMQVMNIYLNLHVERGYAPRPVESSLGSVKQWDAEYLADAERIQKAYLLETTVAQQRLAARRAIRQKQQQEVQRKQRSSRKSQKMLMKFSIG